MQNNLSINSIIIINSLLSYKIKDYAPAAEHFRIAANMCPSRFMPLYKLVKIYVETGRKNEALAMAGRILSKKVKISSATINSIKKEMRQYIDENKPKTYNLPKIKY